MRAATLVLSAITAVALISAALWLREDAAAPVLVAPLEGAQAPDDANTVLVAPEPAHEGARIDVSAGLSPPSAASSDVADGSTAPTPALELGGLRVRVLDDAGVPVPGISVELFMQVAGQGHGQRGRATTRAPDGLARIGLEELAELRARAASLSVSCAFSVAAEVASASPVRAKLDGWPKDGDEVTLWLPARGSVRVHVLTREGAPVTGGAQIAWWWVPAEVAAADPDCAYERMSDHFVAAQAGVASIAGIGLDLTLSFSASVAGFVGVQVRGVEGPRGPGEVRDIELRLGPPVATLRLRALDSAGRPLASMQLHAELWLDPDFVPHPAAGPARPDWFVLTTDGAGIATFTRSPGRVDVAPQLDVTRRSRDKDAASDEHWSTGSVRLPLALAEGEAFDLGDLLLAPVRVLAEGRVVDAAGAPIPRASLWFRERPTPEHTWTNLLEPRFTTGADGRFRVRATRVPKLLAVDVTAKGFDPLSAHELEVGAQDVELVLVRVSDAPVTGAVKVYVELEPDVSPMALLLKLERPRGGGRSPDWWPGQALQVDGLEPGRYDVWLETRDGGLELTRVEGVTVEAGQVAEDPRLLPLDARGLARTVVLECVRGDGGPWRRRSVWVDPMEPRAAFNEKTDDEGLVTLVLPRRINSLVVAVTRERPVQVALGASDTRVRVVLDGE